LNILGLVGKKLHIKEAKIVGMALVLDEFSVQKDQKWDSQVAPNLFPVAMDGTILALYKKF